MKINWGTGIVLAFVAFISFILFFVVRMSMDNRADHDLVTEEYYKHELAYQDEIDAQNNAKKLEKIQLKRTEEGLLVVFPETIDYKKIKGKVSLYRPSNKHLDFDLDLRLSNTSLLIPDTRLLGGRWDLKIMWEYQGVEFLQKESFNY
ncbi:MULTISPECIES: FixH family protein [Bacteroidota]|uniref:FixH family protein n=1 Tax=Euzebyella saccharophila TaxID=679664 RepID=A0ABV8JSA2_9FLAO|nr:MULTISPECIES: FixH family protein [Bacteroidota]MBC7000292.1 FixH family protein [Cytophaga sp. FL35]MDO1499106.1 FixH family protein [Winogradskyella maritima]